MANKVTGKLTSFGDRLKTARKQAGFTQRQLAEKAGLSRRMIVYYEAQGGEPDAYIIVQIAKALRISTDFLLAMNKTEVPTPRKLKLWNSLKRVEELPRNEQKMVTEMIDALVTRKQATQSLA